MRFLCAMILKRTRLTFACHSLHFSTSHVLVFSFFHFHEMNCISYIIVYCQPIFRSNIFVNQKLYLITISGSIIESFSQTPTAFIIQR
uniref:Uncharacterized protein n=1 Tax=Anguilla anguilla TaxID=7936 RepID=A0A0E9XVX4_ANGAN